MATNKQEERNEWKLESNKHIKERQKEKRKNEWENRKVLCKDSGRILVIPYEDDVQAPEGDEHLRAETGSGSARTKPSRWPRTLPPTRAGGRGKREGANGKGGAGQEGGKWGQSHERENDWTWRKMAKWLFQGAWQIHPTRTTRTETRTRSICQIHPHRYPEKEDEQWNRPDRKNAFLTGWRIPGPSQLTIYQEWSGSPIKHSRTRNESGGTKAQQVFKNV